MDADPYAVLGVGPGASEEEVHDAYRRLVKRHHPDRNGGSAESGRIFREVQAAYDELRSRPRRAPPPPVSDASVEARMADLERELREAAAANERVRAAARAAARQATGGGASDEQLGYVTTDDSFGRILGDVRDELSDRLAGARRHPAVKRVTDLLEGLEDLSSRFDR